MKNSIFINMDDYKDLNAVYAVAKGRTIGLLDSWDSCKASINGFSGAVFKKFWTVEEAIPYLEKNGITVNIENDVLSKTADIATSRNISFFDKLNDTAVVYVDGSYNINTGKYGSGVAFLHDNGCCDEYSFSNDNPEKANMRNVAGEIDAAIFAVQEAVKNGYKSIDLFYDYEGIEKWVTGDWKAKNAFTREYAETMHRAMDYISINFSHVKGHSGDKYNDLVDILAKKACGVIEGKTKKDYERE